MSKYPDAIREEFEKKQVQQLIEGIVNGSIQPTEKDASKVRSRIEKASFTPRKVKVEPELQSLEYEGKKLGSKADSLTYHVVKRIFQKEWPPNTTKDEYLADIKRHVALPGVKIAVYIHKGRLIAAVMAENMLPKAFGVDLLPWLFIFYSVGEDAIISCYPAKHEKHANIPGNAIWIK